MMKKRNSKTKNKSAKTVKKTSTNKKKITKSKKNKITKIILNILLVCIIFGIFVTIAFFAYVVIKAPEFNPNNLKFSKMTELYDINGNVYAKLGNENRTEITYDELPEVLIDAIIATEDSKFFEHNGFDLPRFVKASIGQVLGKNAGGASTLTMQIVKNNYTDEKQQRTSGFDGIMRKFTDIYLSIFKVEKKYTKKEIIELYVNDAFLGNGAYGVEQASKNYFNKSVKDLNLAEASYIAGLFQSPLSYNAYNHPERAEKRRKTVLYLMERHGYITKEEKKIAEANPITHYIREKQVSNAYNEYKDYIETMLVELKDEYQINPYTTPVKIYTSMNPQKQDFVNKVMRGEAWNWENDVVQAGIVMTDSNTGEVLAVGAGRNRTGEMSWNYATQTNRHIGSTAKPIFDYGPAVEYLGWGTTNYINDEPHTYSSGQSMRNADGKYQGVMPMYKALGLSRNVPALKSFQAVSKEVGSKKINEFASKLGITPEGKRDGDNYSDIHEAHSIGAFTGSTKKGESTNSPMTMAGAYQTFSNGGYYIKPHTIRRIEFKNTDEVINTKFIKQAEPTIKDSTAYIINYALNWSVTNGLANRAGNVDGVSVAAKTGTSNFDFNNKKIKELGISKRAVNDLWVCGYTPSQTITFWYGYPHLDKNHYSTNATWSIRDRFFRNLAQNLFDKTGATFKAPSSIKTVKVMKNSIPTKLAGPNTPDELTEVGYYRKGTEPTEMSNAHNKLPSVKNIKNTVKDNTINLTWSGITAEDMLNLEALPEYGDIGYDIYIKDGPSGKETYVGTTTSTSYTHKTNYNNPVYVIYTAYSNYKDNKSNGVSHSVTIKSEFDIKISNSEITQGTTFVDNKPIIVLYNSVDVTDKSTIKLISGTVDTNTPGTYKLEYNVTYNGTTKKVSRNVVVKPGGSTNPPNTEENN